MSPRKTKESETKHHIVISPREKTSLSSSRHRKQNVEKNEAVTPRNPSEKSLDIEKISKESLEDVAKLGRNKQKLEKEVEELKNNKTLLSEELAKLDSSISRQQEKQTEQTNNLTLTKEQIVKTRQIIEEIGKC